MRNAAYFVVRRKDEGGAQRGGWVFFSSFLKFVEGFIPLRRRLFSLATGAAAPESSNGSSLCSRSPISLSIWSGSSPASMRLSASFIPSPSLMPVISVNLRIRFAAWRGSSSLMRPASEEIICMAFSMAPSSIGRFSMPPSSLALPVQAKTDICFCSCFWQRGQGGCLSVFTVREKKLKRVLQSSQ